MGLPLSLLELRERQLQTLGGQQVRPVRLVKLAESQYRWDGLDGWPAFLELRLIPRSNFLESASPLPLNQGMRGWFWSGHHVWSDAAAPASILYDNRVTRRGDFQWTLNHVHCTLEADERPGVVRVHTDTETPRLEAILVGIDGAETSQIATPFEWTLHRGLNRLEVRTRNKAGRLGPASVTEIESVP